MDSSANPENVALVASLVFLTALAIARWARRPRSRKARWPTELRDARLWAAERLFVSAGETAISARIDRAYRTRSGTIVLVDLKTRRSARTYFSDVIEMSAQRVAIVLSTEERVAEHGYVLRRPVSGSRDGEFHRMDLLSVADVMALMQRRKELLDGIRQATCADSPALCRGCSFGPVCEARPSEVRASGYQSRWAARKNRHPTTARN